MFFLPSQYVAIFFFEILFLLSSVIFFKLLQRSNALTIQTKQLDTMRGILHDLRKNFDIQELKNTALERIAKELKVDRCFICEFDERTQKFSLVKSEYLDDKSILSTKGTLSKIIANRITKLCISGQSLKIPSIKEHLYRENLSGSPIEEFYKKYSVKSSYLMPLRYSGSIVGLLVLHYTKKETSLANSEIKFLEEITDSLAIAIHQSELYLNQKKIAERETLLRIITKTIKSSFDYEEIQQSIVKNIGEALKANRCFIADYDKKTQTFLPIKTEYLSPSNTKSYIGYNLEAGHEDFLEKSKEKRIIVIQNAEDYIKENLKQGSYVEKHLHDFSIKSLFSVPITYQDEILGLLILHYTKEENSCSEDAIDFVKSVADQTGVALYQSILYEKQKQAAQKEKLLRYFITTIRESLNIEDIKHKIVTETGKLLHADRVFIIEVDEQTDKYLPVAASAEYLSDKGLKSITDMDLSMLEGNTIISQAKNLRLDLIHPDLDEFFEEKQNLNPRIKQFVKDYGIKASIILNIMYTEKFFGNLVIHYNQKKQSFSEDELEYLKTIANQIAIAIHQSYLFKKAQQHANKESVLRQLISEIKLSNSLENAYEKLLEETAKVYNVNRVLFLESSPLNQNELLIKAEHVKESQNNHSCLDHIVFPQVCINDFLNLIHNFETLVIDNVKNCYPDDKTMSFFKKHNINSMMAIPLVKKNKSITVFGFVILCDKNVKIWTDYDIHLLESIGESVISVLWEISKFNEIEDLRNSFILTLAHDFQVPLIGERNALEYLIQYATDKIGDDAPLLKEILENNKNIIALLNKSVEIYSYEANRKVLDFDFYDTKMIIKAVTESFKEKALEKKITIITKFPDKNVFVYVDKLEIIKVLETILQNAIEKSPKSSKIIINVTRSDESVEISIKDKGPGIPKEMQEKLFKRYEMALAIERKIGAGTGLYLAKRIMQAHNGSIYFETTKNEGTVFYVTLPVLEKK